MPVKEIYGGVIALKNGKFVTVLEVLPLNFYLKSEFELITTDRESLAKRVKSD